MIDKRIIQTKGIIFMWFAFFAYFIFDSRDISIMFMIIGVILFSIGESIKEA